MTAPLMMAALSIGSTAASFAAQAGAASAQEEANAQANEQAREQMITDYDQMTRMGQQEVAAATQKQNQNQIDAAKARATTRVAAGEGGVGGLSVDALLRDLYGQEATIRDSVNQNLENTTSQLGYERQGVYTSGVNAINSRPIVQRPSALGAALGGASGAYGAYADTLRIQKQLKGG